MRIFGQAEFLLRVFGATNDPIYTPHHLEGEPGVFASGYHNDLLSATEGTVKNNVLR